MLVVKIKARGQGRSTWSFGRKHGDFDFEGGCRPSALRPATVAPSTVVPTAERYISLVFGVSMLVCLCLLVAFDLDHLHEKRNNQSGLPA
ncbi:hypothetical protein ACLOJK_018628 [Asimina triloba]